MKIVIVGGVAGGASAAARARRLSEEAEIVVIERGAHPSFANCGLPYYVGGEIESRDKLLVAPIQLLRERLKLDVRVRSEVTKIDPQAKAVTVKELESGKEYTESYDSLIIATGASPFRPPLPGIDNERIVSLRDLNDADRMRDLAINGATQAVIVGAGFIGIEVAENLIRRGIKTTIVELANQILPPWDQEMILPLQRHLIAEGIDLRLGASAAKFESDQDKINVTMNDSSVIPADFVVLCIGVRPDSKLAAEAGIECGPRGGIRVTSQMETNIPDIYAVGDVVETKCSITGDPIQIPLAGPANRQGRIAADRIFQRDSQYRGTQGTAVVGMFGQTAAMTGMSEKVLRAKGISYEKIYLHPTDHAGYFPGAKQMLMKLLFSPDDGKILGAQAAGTSGVDKRMDVIAMAIQAGMTVYDLEEAELCYAPQYGHAKDPVNMAGFIASGVLRGDQPIIHASTLADESSAGLFILDVRTTGEYAKGHIPGAVNIPIEELRDRIQEVPADKSIATYCQVGQRGYLATRLLLQHGMNARNISGGYRLWSILEDPS
ncbi:CoA-disulfide reductase [Blastopirellula marina]|uniref:CoA-disulfide reductase n=1 Tax=Blastopirellula marina TaxID=124 RepID=A0A2S8EZE2_9BACT|nr:MULTISPECIES: FAD-dependent oxidoreductase [Pirellulaceae]PQO25273.1 CoA-disulfide reductase [Blastopirellula marina]RCS41706.1 CoA-disulfide reductase [Bremerella cremea]